jgi:hypothetical protein
LRDGRAWLDDFAGAARRLGLAYTPGVHIYVDNETGLAQQWAWVRNHCARWGLRECIVTECGAGPDRPIEAWRDIMPRFYGLLDDPLCRALAPFGAYPQADNAGNWPGFMAFDGTVNILGQQWLAERNRRA